MPIHAPTLLRSLFDAAVASALPATRLAEFLPPPPPGRTIVVGAGKAAGAMARALEDHWQGPLEGIVVTRYGHKVDCRQITVAEAAHPVPDQAGLDAARKILDAVSGLGPEDLVLFLASGGGSALLTLPVPGLTLADKQAVNRALLRSGATIGEINCVRKHLSAIKGGRLAQAAAPARLVTLMISDVPGDDPSVIASGPTVPDPTTFADALAILDKYAIGEPAAALAHLRAAAAETPKPGDACFANTETRMIARPQDALEAAARLARAQGITPLILGDSLEGEARDVALVHAGIARQAIRYGQPAPPPVVLLSGGEVTVTIRGDGGRGGPNQEFLLALAVALQGQPGIWAVAGDTDGVDGSEEVAGAVIAPDTLRRAEALGLSAKARLAGNDAYSFFEALGDLVVTGPTLTNVNDFRAILIDPTATG